LQGTRKESDKLQREYRDKLRVLQQATGDSKKSTKPFDPSKLVSQLDNKLKKYSPSNRSSGGDTKMKQSEERK